MGGWEKLFGGSESESEVSAVSTQTEEQQALMKSLASYLEGKLGTSTEYGGNLTVGTPAALTAASETLVNLTDLITPTLQQWSTGKISAEQEEAFQSGVVNPLLKTLREDILPATGERFLGTGSFDSSTRAIAEGKAAGDVASQIATKRYEMFQEAQNRVGQAATVASELASAASTISQDLYGIEALNIANLYSEFVRQNEEASGYTSQILEYLGLSAIENIVTVEETTETGLVPAVAQLISSVKNT